MDFWKWWKDGFGGYPWGYSREAETAAREGWNAALLSMTRAAGRAVPQDQAALERAPGDPCGAYVTEGEPCVVDGTRHCPAAACQIVRPT